MFPFSLLHAFRSFYYRFVGRLRRVNVFRVEGLLKDGNATSADIVFVGDGSIAQWFSSLVLSKIERMTCVGECRHYQVDPSKLPQGSIMVAQAKQPMISSFAKNGYLLLPLVEFCMNLEPSFEKLVGRTSSRRRRNIKKLSRFNYSCAVCRNDDSEFDLFYYGLYLPFVRKRFGESAQMQSYVKLRTICRRNGGIVFVRDGDRTVAGVLFRVSGNTVYAMCMGTYGGEYGFVKELACQKALLHLIEWARKEGLTCLNYGATLPFYSDHVFQYKKEWGMVVRNKQRQPFCLLKLEATDDSFLAFVRQNPFVFLDDNRLTGVVIVDRILDRAGLETVASRHFLRGVDSLVVIAYSQMASSMNARNAPDNKPSNSDPKLMKPLVTFCDELRNRGFEVRASRFTEPPKVMSQVRQTCQ